MAFQMVEYIEKQAAIKAVCDACCVMPDGEKDTCPYKYEGAGCREYDRIIEIPPADVRPVVRGRWEDKQFGPWGAVYATCSACRGRVTLDPAARSFCPCCGADMREADNGFSNGGN